MRTAKIERRMQIDVGHELVVTTEVIVEDDVDAEQVGLAAGRFLNELGLGVASAAKELE